MLRETTFYIGGALTIALGVLLAVGLLVSNAGWAYAQAWVAVLVSVGLGAFFIHVGRAEGRYRREYLAALESGRPPPPGGPPV